MSTHQAIPSDLSPVHDIIIDLGRELDSTVLLAEQLTRIGRADDALLLLEDERRSLSRTVESLAERVATPRRSWWNETHRKIAGAAAVATLVAVTGGMWALTVGGGTEQRLGLVNARIERIPAIVNPADRLVALRAAAGDVGTLPEGARADITRRISPMIERTRDELRRDDTQKNRDLAQSANQLATDVERGRYPPPPDSTDRTLLDSARGLLRN